MNNPNALIAMAQVSQNANNPYLVFCEYIKYCLFVDETGVMSIKSLKDAIGKEFGIQMPYNVITICLRQLEQDEMILSSRKHLIERTGYFNTNEFNKERQHYQSIEDSLIDSLITYALRHNKIWDKKYARTQLIKVLDRNGLAYDIFMQSDLLTNNDYNLFSNDEIEELLSYDEEIQELNDSELSFYPDSYYVGNFIKKIINNNDESFTYLQQVCKGLMLCAGTYQLTNTNKPQIKGTTFFFDTKLLLRLLGCAGVSAIESTNELVKLIQDNGGIICYYPQTWHEIDKAFEKAITCLQKGYPIRDVEMHLFVSKIKNAIEVLKAKRKGFEKELEYKNIYQRKNAYFTDTDRLNFGFNYDDFQQYMKKYLGWDDYVIENDALSIWETHMLREGKYSDYCGTKDKLPVFVTTNARLIGISLSYRKDRPNDKGIRDWKSNRLPVITDMRLTCRLWNPASQVEKISSLYLTANIIAAQRPSEQFYNKIRELAIQFKESNVAYNDIYLPSFFDDNIAEAIFEVIQGDDEKLNIGSFTSTIEELFSVQIKEKEELNRQITKEKVNIQNEYDLQTKEIIDSAVQKHKNHLGVLRIDLFVILNWRTILNLVFIAIGAILSYLSGNCGLLFIAILPVLLTLIEKFCTSNFVIKRVLKKQFPRLEQIFNNKIEKRLSSIELKYKNEIIKQVKEQTSLFDKCVKLLNEGK